VLLRFPRPLILVAAFLLPSGLRAQTEEDVMTMRIAPVAPGLYVISGFTNGNIAVLVGTDGRNTSSTNRF
jgi:hypothetical protein